MVSTTPSLLAHAVRRFIKLLLTAFALCTLALAAAGLWWLDRALPMPASASVQAPLHIHIARGMSSRAVAQALVNAGMQGPPALFYAWFVVSGRSRDIKAGYYEFAPGITPVGVLDKLVRGEQALARLTLIEGWNLGQVLRALRAAPDLTQDLEHGLSPEALMARLGYPGWPAEGRFFPDTYVVPKHTRASEVLRQAARAMTERLDAAWAQRWPHSPLRTPHEALILASLIEKETGRAADRAMISGVLSNRLRLGMRLQTDPSVIYGLGAAFDGNLRRTHLRADTPYNTYTRAGLPPSPIAMPSWDSLLAAVQPARTGALYFVARGDGSSHFSDSLAEHNAAVRRYVLKRPPAPMHPAPGRH